MRQLVYKFIKFGLVGSLGTVVDFIVTALCMVLFGLKDYILESVEAIASNGFATKTIIILILLSNFVGFVVAASSNFCLNRIWTWKSSDPNIRNQYLKFLLVSVIGLMINLSIIYICNLLLEVEFVVCGVLINRFWIAKIIATAVVMLWNFIINNIYTFKVLQS